MIRPFSFASLRIVYSSLKRRLYLARIVINVDGVKGANHVQARAGLGLATTPLLGWRLGLAASDLGAVLGLWLSRLRMLILRPGISGLVRLVFDGILPNPLLVLPLSDKHQQHIRISWTDRTISPFICV